ncbi:MAG: hypothetical protein ACHQIM_20390 [Sphingobacteriales bacterium]
MITLLLLTLAVSADSPSQLHEDSVLIYNTYKDEIDSLLKAESYMAWAIKQGNDDSITAAAFKRLKEHNHIPYAPVKMQNREGYGVGYLYPNPANPEPGLIEIDSATSKFSIVAIQTKFITDGKGKTRKPYIERVYYGPGGEIRYVERLNPITWQRLTE